jgi:hypothetical protein
MNRLQASKAFHYGLLKLATEAEDSERTLRRGVGAAAGVAGTAGAHHLMSRNESDAIRLARKLNTYYGLAKKKKKFFGRKIDYKALKALGYGGIPIAAAGYGATYMAQRSGKKNKELAKYKYLTGDL